MLALAEYTSPLHILDPVLSLEQTPGHLILHFLSTSHYLRLALLESGRGCVAMRRTDVVVSD